MGTKFDHLAHAAMSLRNLDFLDDMRIEVVLDPATFSRAQAYLESQFSGRGQLDIAKVIGRAAVTPYEPKKFTLVGVTFRRGEP